MTEYFQKYIKKEYLKCMPKIKYKTNFTNCILEAFKRRGFQETQNDDWDIIWSEKDNIPEIYERRIQSHQKINHFRNYFELCRKDLLVRNLKKHKKTLQRQGKPQQSQTYNYYPQTYVLPAQYVIFADQFKKQSHVDGKNIWIMKPAGKSQGKGIFLFNKLSQISQWENHTAQNYIVQKYINDPLLIGGKKFDIRIYVLVISYTPLIVYLYRSGFARFTHCRYEQSKIQNSEIHLTNVAIQKNAQGYDQNIGGKWYLDKLKLFLISKYGNQNVNNSFLKIQKIILKTLEAVQKIMGSDKTNSFQLYGFDILLDSKLQPWLIEVNGSPSMTANTQTDNLMKLNLLSDTLTIIDILIGNQQQIGGFDLIYRGVTKKSNIQPTLIQKISFLGSFNNRQQNLKKLAKNNSIRLNLEFSTRKDTQQKKLMTQSNAHNTVQSSKRNIISRKGTKNNNNSNNNTNHKQFVIKQKYKKDQNQFRQIL